MDLDLVNRHKYPKIDIFLYNGEDIIFYRLKYLFQIIDEFVIVESRYTFSGCKKEELFFEKYFDKFIPYINKITYRLIETFPPELKYKYKQYRRPEMSEYTYIGICNCIYQRDYAQEYIKSKYLGRKYLIHFSDVDEIPSIDVIKNLNLQYKYLSTPAYLELINFFYNCKWCKKYTRKLSFVCNDICLENMTFSYMRSLMDKSHANFYRYAGWHFNYFMTPSKMIHKLKSSMYQIFEGMDPCLENTAYLQSCIDNGYYLHNNLDKAEALIMFENVKNVVLPDDIDALNKLCVEKI